jgi:energy-converting hydrogenase Eha subunit F
LRPHLVASAFAMVLLLLMLIGHVVSLSISLHDLYPPNNCQTPRIENVRFNLFYNLIRINVALIPDLSLLKYRSHAAHRD